MSSVARVLELGLVACALASGACSSSSDGESGGNGSVSFAGGPSTAGGVNGGGTGAPSAQAGSGGAPAAVNSDPVGSFTVRLEAKRSITTVAGAVRDAPVIEATPYTGDRKSGDCQLFLAKAPFCAEQCAVEQVCATSGTCVARPKNLSAGTVTLRGLAAEGGASEVSMDPIGSTKSYGLSGGVKLQYPPAAPGEEIRLSASGADTVPFEIVARAVGPIQGFSQDPAPLNRDQPLELTWTAAPGSEIEVVLEIAHHGGARGRVMCAAPDSGALAIPADLVTALLDLGVAGFPDVSVTRKAAGRATSAPRVELIVFADASRPVSIAGLTSCNTEDDCPAGQTCGQDKACAGP